MKPVLTLYFLRHIGAAILLIWTATWALLVCFDFLREAGDGALTARVFLIVLLESPRPAMEILPFACAIGCAIAMNRMVSNGEMPALRTAGLSPLAIVLYQFIAILPFAAAYILLSETLLPDGNHLARVMQNQQQNQIHGLWLTENNDYIHIGQIKNSNAMVSIVIYHTDGNQLTGITRAAAADYQQDSNDWQLQRINRIRLDSTGTKLQETEQNASNWQLQLPPSSFDALADKPREMAALKAMRAAADLSAAGQQNHALEKIAWQRWLTLIALPLLAAGGVNFIGGNRRHHHAVSLPVFISLLTAGGYILLRDFFIQTALISGFSLLFIAPLLLAGGYIAYSVRRAEIV